MTRILIGGDICPIGKIQAAFTAGRAGEIFHDLLPEIQAADLAIANLECPLVSQPSPIAKAGPVLEAPPGTLRGIAEARWHLLNLANNHSFDHGAKGLDETIAAVRKAGIAVVGAGTNLREAGAPFVTVINGRRIVVYSMAEREFSVADAVAGGSNPLDLISFVAAVRQHKQDGIFIALVHGGREHYDYPTPEMIRRCRFMVEMGADAVVCCHTHCPLPWETHHGKPIIYGLGNLVFESFGTLRPAWHQGYLARLEIAGSQVHFEPVLYTQSLDQPGARLLAEPAAHALRQELAGRGAELADADLMAAKWRTFCQREKDDYLWELFAQPRKLQRFRKTLLPLLHSRHAVLQALLLVQCETHREVLEEILRDERTRP